MKFYIDDMLVKSLKAIDHLDQPRFTFYILGNIKWNFIQPSELLESQQENSLLNYLLRRALIGMPSLRSKKDVQRLNGE